MIKNYFRILKKPHAYLHTILKTPVKFQKDWTETVGGVKGTKYPLKTRNHAPGATHHAPRTTPHGKPKTVSLHFSSKRRGTITKGKNCRMESVRVSFLNVICLLNVLYILVKYHENILTCFKVMVCTNFLQFQRQGDITHGPSQLELSFLYPTPLPNALYNLTEFQENSSKGTLELWGAQ